MRPSEPSRAEPAQADAAQPRRRFEACFEVGVAEAFDEHGHQIELRSAGEGTPGAIDLAEGEGPSNPEEARKHVSHGKPDDDNRDKAGDADLDAHNVND